MSKTPSFVLWGATLLVAAAFAWPRLTDHPAGPATAAVPPGPSSGDAVGAAEEDRLAREPIRPLPAMPRLDVRRVELGRRLFHDACLSKDGTVSCASCHSLDLGGADSHRVSSGVGGAQGERNAPTVLNCRYNFKQFWDGRADSLEQQVDGPLLNPVEMAGTWKQTLEKLRAAPDYRTEFAEIYSDEITEANVRDAIATFERSLVTPNSRFDRYLRGERAVLSTAEVRGYELFKEVGCTSCHQGVNVGGTMFQTLGRMADYVATHGGREKADLGRFKVTGREEDRYRFKVPTLRNVSLTAPYLHDGSVPTLDGAVRLMAEYQLGVELPDADVKDIVAFLETLTGTYEPR